MISAGRILLMPRGAFDANVQYDILDLVSYNGSSYIAFGPTIGNLPTDTTKWMLSAYGGNAANVAGNFAVIETTDIATVTHYEGTLFVDENSQFMKATQTINIGDTIVSGTNCTPTTVEQLLNEITAYVDGLDSRNRKLHGVTEIAAQTDLHGLALGEYYKDKTTFYVTNAPVGIANVPSAVFRLTVEAGSQDASLANSPLLLTLRTLDGKTYTQGFDGNNWGAWIEAADQASTNNAVSAVAASVEATQDSIAPVESATATSAHLAGSQLYYNDVLYDVTANISIGDALADGVNIQAASESITEHFSSEIQTLTNNDDAMLNVLGAKNLLQNLAASQVVSSVTYTVQSDGRVQASGTATGSFSGLTLNSDCKLSKGRYVVSGCPVGGAGSPTSHYVLYVDVNNVTVANDVGEGATFELTDESATVSVGIAIAENETVDLTFYPMIRPAEVQDSTYVPYAMTNRGLTERKTDRGWTNYVTSWTSCASFTVPPRPYYELLVVIKLASGNSASIRMTDIEVNQLSPNGVHYVLAGVGSAANNVCVYIHKSTAGQPDGIGVFEQGNNVTNTSLYKAYYKPM